MCVGSIWKANYVWTCLFQMGTTEFRLNEVAIWLFGRKSLAMALAMGMPGRFQGWFPWGNPRFLEASQRVRAGWNSGSHGWREKGGSGLQFGSTRFQLHDPRRWRY